MRASAALLFVLLLLPAIAAAADDPVSPALATALSEPSSPARTADGTYAVWVRFADKGLAGKALEQALDDAEAALNDRSQRRRAKSATARSGRLVDVTDLNLHRPYVDGVAATGASLRRESRWLNAASFDATAEQIRAMAELPFVAGLDLVRHSRRPDPVVESAPEPVDPDKASRWTLDYGGSLAELEQINVPAVHEEGWNGQGVLIGMLDSGFITVHEALSSLNIVDAWDFVNDDGIVENEVGDPSDAHNHGTMTLSTVGGYMPGAHIAPAFGASFVLAKTEDTGDEQPVEEDNWVAGIEWLDTFGIDVASSSLGYLDWYVFADMDGNTAPCTIAADLAVAKGIVVVNSAGNERGSSWDHIIAPADGDSVIATAAVTSTGALSYFSSPGPSADGRIKPDVAARGSGNHVASPSDPNSYSSVSGTSFSCPLTSGVAALVLSRNPQLTPMQVREALRQTASQPAAPDNDFGWGLLDAWAAVHYFGATIAHDGLGDTEDVVGPYTVTAAITDREALDPAALLLHWRVDGGPWQQTALASAGGDLWTADIPGQAAGADVDYWLEAGDVLGIVSALPADAPTTAFTFHVGPDVTAPSLAHAALGNQPLLTWPPVVQATASDNIGLAGVDVEWSLNGTPQAPFALTQGIGDLWSAPFNLDASSVAIGDMVSYTVTATDLAAVPNATVSGPHAFDVIDALGVVLLVDDTGAKSLGDVKVGLDKIPLAPQESKAKTSATDMARWLTEAGYVVTEQSWAAFTAADLAGKQALILSSGSNTAPVADAAQRDVVIAWVQGGGKVLVEGGEVGYDALSSPGYPDFAAQVLHADDWRGDSAGDLQAVAAQAGHPLLNSPHALPATVGITYSAYGDEDALDPAAGAVTVMETATYSGAAGLLAYDDNLAPQAGQVVMMAFNVAAVTDTVVARQMTENAVGWLLASEGAPTSALSGTVWGVSGDVIMPLPGAVVTLATGQADTSGVDGSWSIAGLYAGTYRATCTAVDFATTVMDVTVGEGETLTGVDFDMLPAYFYDAPWVGPVAIPDNDPVGVTTTVDVTAPGTIAEVTLTIDLRHTWIGDLVVELTSPTGTVVRLHDRSGSSADDIVGTWDTTLTVDGPGSLADFLGETAVGTWTLFVSDNVGSDTGTIESFTLHVVTSYVDTGVDDGPPLLTALGPAAPNPFNPRTEIRFSLAAPATPRLDVFDLKGRLVRSLLRDQAMQPGAHAVIWNGRSDAGREVASGVYLVRMRAEGLVFERKITLTR